MSVLVASRLRWSGAGVKCVIGATAVLLVMLASGFSSAVAQADPGLASEAPAQSDDLGENGSFATLGGTVKDPTGNLLAGVRVMARNLTAAPETTTSAQGGFNLSLPPGIYNLVALPDAYPPWHKYLALTASGHTQAVDLIMGPARPFALSGTVRDAQSGAAIAGATIEVRDRAFTSFVRKLSGAGGNFSFSVSAGDFALDISSAGYSPRRVEMPISADAPGLDIRLLPTALGSTVSGNVREIRQNGSIASTTAQIVITGNHGFRAEAIVGGAGNYNIPVPSNQTLTVEVYNNSRLSKPVTAASGAANVDFILPVDIDNPRTFAILNPPQNASLTRPVGISGQVNDSNGGAAGGRILVGEYIGSSGGIDEFGLRKVFGGRGAADLTDSGPLPFSRGADLNLSFTFAWNTWYQKGLFTDSVLTGTGAANLDHWTWGDFAVPASFKVNVAAPEERSIALFRLAPGATVADLEAVVVNRSGTPWLATKDTQSLGVVAVAEIVELVSSSTGDLVGEVERPGQFLELARGITMLPRPNCGRHMVAPIGWDHGNNRQNSVSTLHLDNCAPEAKIEGPSLAQPSAPFTLDGSNSTDDTFIASHDWTITGPKSSNHSGAVWTTSLDTEGDYNIKLSVTDGAGNRGEISRSLKVSKIVDNEPPVAVGSVPPMIKVGIQFPIDARQSSDNIGIVKYQWDWSLNGSNVGSSALQFENVQLNAIGLYRFVLTVWDGAGNSDSDTDFVRVVNVVDPTPPRADAGGNRLVTEASQVACDSGNKHVESGELVFDGSNSTDEGGSKIQRWNWTISREGNLVAASALRLFVHAFTADGTYQVTLEVEDGAFNQDTDTIVVEVLAYDSEPDGLPDAWERTYFGDLHEVAAGDPDNDGVNNKGEMCGLSDPRLAESYSTPAGEGLLGMLGLLMPIIVLGVGGAIIALILRRLKRRGEGEELPPGT